MSAFRPTGHQEYVSLQRQLSARTRFEERYKRALKRHEHLWVATVAYHVTPPLTGGTLLDADAMIHDPAVGCYICERDYSSSLAGLHCSGDPA